MEEKEERKREIPVSATLVRFLGASSTRSESKFNESGNSK